MNMAKIKQINRNSDLFAVFIAETLVCAMIGALVEIPMLSVIITAGLVVGITINNRGHIYFRNYYPFFLIVIIMIMLIFSALKNGLDNVLTYAMNFACFGMASFLFASTKLNTQRTIHTLVRIYFVYLIFYVFVLRNIFLSSSDYWNRQMGVAYGFVPIIILSVLIWTYPSLYTTKKKHNYIVPLIGILAVLFMFIDTGTRGAIVVAFVGIVCIFLTKQANWKKIVLILFLGCLSLGCIYHYREIIIAIDDILSSMGIEIGAINKMIFMINQGNEFNGRDVLSVAAQNYFMESPIFGHGIGFFESKEGTYPHNLFWQLLCEYGVIGTIMVCGLLSKRIKKLFLVNKGNLYHLELFVFLSSVPVLFFSNTYWTLPLFWIFLFMDKKVI